MEPGEPGLRLDGEPAISVMILPGEGQPGMLESLLCETFAGDDRRACVDEFLACAEKVQGKAHPRRAKARAHAFLATTPDPHLSVGYAAKRGHWDFEHVALAPLRCFLADIAV